MAQEGEFCKRAVLNDKLDLVQAEAINELIHANTQMALKQSLAQLEGSFSQWITTIEQDLIQAMAFCLYLFLTYRHLLTYPLQFPQNPLLLLDRCDLPKLP